MTITIELTDSGTAAFNAFFDANAKPGVRREAVAFELVDVLADRVAADESLSYELAAQFTTDGRPAHLMLDAADISVTHEADE